MSNEQKIKARVILNAGIDSFGWLLMTTIIGMTQTIILLIVTFLITGISFETTKLLKDGSLLVFCMSIVAAIILDLHYSKKQTGDVLTESLFFKFFPWAPVVFVAVSTTINLVGDPSKINTKAIATLQICAILLSFSYCYCYKFLMFISNYKKN